MTALGLAGCVNYPEGADRYLSEAGNSEVSLQTKVPAVVPNEPKAMSRLLMSERHPVHHYKSVVSYSTPPSHLMEILPPPIMVEEPGRRCGAQRGNSVYEGMFNNPKSWGYRYLDNHREGVRGTMDWLVDGVFADLPHDVAAYVYNKPDARRTTETQFFRAFERHDLCLSGKPNTMGGGRAFCDAELKDDLVSVCTKIYVGGYAKGDCKWRAWLVANGVAGIGGPGDKNKEIHFPYANISATCTNYRGWTPPADQLIKVRTLDKAPDLLRISATQGDGQTGHLVFALKGSQRDEVSFDLDLAAMHVCGDPKQPGQVLMLITCGQGGSTLAELRLQASDFLMTRPVAVDFDGDGRDEVLLLALAGADDCKLKTPGHSAPCQPLTSEDGQRLVSLVALPVALRDGQVHGRPFLMKDYKKDANSTTGDDATVAGRLVSLLSERPLAGSFLIDNVHQATRDGVIYRPQQVALSSITYAHGDSRKLFVRTASFEMTPNCRADQDNCFTRAVMTTSSFFKDGRIDPNGEVHSGHLTTHVEMYKRMAYPPDVQHYAANGGDALTYYYAGSGVTYKKVVVPQYIERTTLGPVQVGDIYNIDLASGSPDGWPEQVAQDDDVSLQNTCTNAVSAGTPPDKNLDRQLNWFGCRDAGTTGPGATHTAYRSWSKLLYPAVREPDTNLRLSAFLTNCDAIDEIRSQCHNDKNEIIRLAVIDENKPDTVTYPADAANMPVFGHGDGQVELVDIDNTQWALTQAEKKSESATAKTNDAEDITKAPSHDRKALSCTAKKWQEAACEWLELPSYTGHFGRDGEPGILFVKKEDMPGGTGNKLLRPAKSLSLLAIYRSGDRWKVDPYTCDIALIDNGITDPSKLLKTASPYWLVAANAMVLPGAARQDQLVFPLTRQTADLEKAGYDKPANRWGWVRIVLDNQAAPVTADRTYTLPCHPDDATAANWSAAVTAVLPQPPARGKLPFGVLTATPGR